MYLSLRTTAGGLLLLLALALSACGGGGGAAGALQVRQAAGFTLRVLPGTHIDAASQGDFMLDVQPGADEITVSVRVSGAQRLRAAYFDLEYDAMRLSPAGIEPGPALRDLAAGGDLLALNIADEPGVVHSGQVLPGCLEASGFSGEGVIARLRFARRAFARERRISTPPNTAASATVASFDSGSGELSWRFYSQGDYNQNGQVGLTDLTPLGVHFAQSVAYPAEVDTAQAAIDGNADGVLNIADVTPIGVNFGKDLLHGWNVYHSLNAADYPTDAADDNGAANFIATIDTANYDVATNPGVDRVRYSTVLPAPAVGEHYWVRPEDVTNVEGIASNDVVISTPGNTAPVIANIAPDAISVGSGGMLGVSINATDADGDPLTYGITTPQGSISPGPFGLNSFLFWAPAVGADTGVILEASVDDGNGGIDTQQFMINVLVPVGGNSAPLITSVSALPPTVLSGGAATLTCAANDADGDTLAYTWQPGLGTLTGTGSSVNWTAPTVVVDTIVNIVAHVDDGHGHSVPDSSLNITVTVASNMAPTAVLATTGAIGDGTTGIAPHFVHFDGTGSSDPDGDPLTYAWDFDGDAVTDSTAASGDFTYFTPGGFNAALTVSDGTATDTMSRLITVADPGSWHSQTLAGAADDSGQYCSLAEINSVPGVAFRSHDGVNAHLNYMSAGDAQGSFWGSIETVPGVSPQWISLAQVHASPAIAYYEYGIVVPLLAYTRFDGALLTWSTPLQLDAATDAGNYCSLLSYGGVPTISYYQTDYIDGQLRYLGATDANGSTWLLPATVDGAAGVDTGKYTSMADINGLLALSYFDAGTTSLKFAIASDFVVSSWNTYTVETSATDDVGRYCSLAQIAGHPAIAYANGTTGRTLYERAVDAGGTDWSATAWILAEGAGLDCALADIAGQPAVAYRKSDGSLQYTRSGTPFDFSVMGGGQIDDVPGENVGYYINLKQIGGRPCVAYYNNDAKDLLFAVQYP